MNQFIEASGLVTSACLVFFMLILVADIVLSSRGIDVIRMVNDFGRRMWHRITLTAVTAFVLVVLPPIFACEFFLAAWDNGVPHASNRAKVEFAHFVRQFKDAGRSILKGEKLAR